MRTMVDIADESRRRNAPADLVEVVRCKDCKWQHTLDCPMNYEVETYDDDDGWDRYMSTNAYHDDGFCWIGVREDGDG